MLLNILKFLHGAAVLVFGVTLTAVFSRIRFTKRNIFILLGFIVFSGGFQAVASQPFREDLVWKLYPVITHLPLILLLFFVYHKPPAAAMAATFTAYLFCQPSKWVGVFVYSFTNSEAAELIARILCLIPCGYIAVVYLASCFADIFTKDKRTLYIFWIVPTVYYMFDYITVVYTDLWLGGNQVIMEFLPLFLALFYMVFCFVYYKEHELKTDAQRREQIIQITVNQQAKEIAAVRQIEQELRLLRHDMRLFLSSLAVCIENGETDAAREMIDAHITRIDGIKLERFCSNDIVNYVLSDYAARCKNDAVQFRYNIALQEMTADEIMFCSILSNALDNALNAQKLLPADRRSITLMLKNVNGRMLLSVENPVAQNVVFVDGLPVSHKRGHGYGTQSIQYLTEQLGGNCQFSVKGGTFILRVVL